jgi:hypothetical protein
MSICDDALCLYSVFFRHLKSHSGSTSNEKIWCILRCRFVWDERRNVCCPKRNLQPKRLLNIVAVRNCNHKATLLV